LNFPASGPHEPAIPSTSRSIVQATSFWYTTGASHQPATSHTGPSPLVQVASEKPARPQSTIIFTTYVV
jgi:hypothetical protein